MIMMVIMLSNLALIIFDLLTGLDSKNSIVLSFSSLDKIPEARIIA